jgi:hypothetical protein
MAVVQRVRLAVGPTFVDAVFPLWFRQFGHGVVEAEVSCIIIEDANRSRARNMIAVAVKTGIFTLVFTPPTI